MNTVNCNEWATYVIMRGFHHVTLRIPGGISSRRAQHSSRESGSLHGGDQTYSRLLLAWCLVVFSKTCWHALAYVAISHSRDILNFGGNNNHYHKSKLGEKGFSAPSATKYFFYVRIFLLLRLRAYVYQGLVQANLSYLSTLTPSYSVHCLCVNVYLLLPPGVNPIAVK
jgi:hypothetical protein